MSKRKMNRLALNRGYLCGAMDRVLDGGVGWRQDLKDSLKDLKVLWLDPTRKPINIGVEDLENRALRQKAKRAGDFEFVRNQMKQIRPVDLRMVDICDFLVVNIDLDVHATRNIRRTVLGEPDEEALHRAHCAGRGAHARTGSSARCPSR